MTRFHQPLQNDNDNLCDACGVPFLVADDGVAYHIDDSPEGVRREIHGQCVDLTEEAREALLWYVLDRQPYLVLDGLDYLLEEG